MKKRNKSFRNVLSLPQDLFWPLLQPPQSETLLVELRMALNLAKTIRPELEWIEIRKMTKEERQKEVNKFFQNISHEERELHEKAKKLKKTLAIGINEVCRSLEKKELACCLLHGKAKPKMILTHVLQLANNIKIPVLILNDLKENMKDSLGYSSLAIGISKEVLDNQNHEYFKLCTLVMNFSKNLSNGIDERINFKCEDISLKEMSVVTDDKKTDCISVDTDDKRTDFMDMIIRDYSSFYLHRTSSNYRVFHPPEEGEDSDEEKSGLLSEETPKPDNIIISMEKYIPLKKARYFEQPTILRVQSNPNKIRKKGRRNKK